MDECLAHAKKEFLLGAIKRSKEPGNGSVILATSNIDIVMTYCPNCLCQVLILRTPNMPMKFATCNWKEPE